jgi:GNAT superfamily N-acetyltransferase
VKENLDAAGGKATRRSNGCEVRKMREEDREAVLGLVEDVYGKDMSVQKMAQWRWLYERNPNNPPGGPRAMLVADGRKIVGLFRCIPVPMKIGERYFTNDWNVDLMIHPDYRKHGLALDLARALLAEGDVNTGLPLTGSPTYVILDKIGRFVDVGPFPQIVLPVRKLPFARAVFKLPVVSHVAALVLGAYYSLVVGRRPYEADGTIELEEIEAFDDAFDEFWERVHGDYPIIVKRDAKYLQWKFFERPDTSYTVYRALRSGIMAGYIVLRSDERFGVRTGFIVDILAKKDDVKTIEALVRKAIEVFRGQNVDQISTQMFFVPTFRGVFRKAGFVTKPTRRVRRIVLTVNNEKVPRDVLRKPENWFITRNYAHQEM